MKKERKKIIAFILIMTLAFLNIGTENSIFAAEKVKLNKRKIAITVGMSTTLSVKGTTKKVKWSTSKRKVAIVNSKGKVTAKKEGSCKIKAKVSQKTYTCKVTVKAKKTKVTTTITPLPSANKQEEVTVVPEATEMPKITPNSQETETPQMTSSPKETETLQITSSPKETETPQITSSPKETEIPQMTSSPKETETPQITSSPKETETPQMTSSPKETETPQMTSSPKETETPQITSSPKETETPQMISSPKETETPKMTSSSKATEIPQMTSNSKETETPKMTSSPKATESFPTASTSEVIPTLTSPPNATGESGVTPMLTSTPNITCQPETTETPQYIVSDMSTPSEKFYLFTENKQISKGDTVLLHFAAKNLAMDTMILSFHYDEEIFERITKEDIVVCDEMSLLAYNEAKHILYIEGKANNYLDDIIITFSLKVKKQSDSYTFGIEEANAAYLGEDITLMDSVDIVFGPSMMPKPTVTPNITSGSSIMPTPTITPNVTSGSSIVPTPTIMPNVTSGSSIMPTPTVAPNITSGQETVETPQNIVSNMSTPSEKFYLFTENKQIREGDTVSIYLVAKNLAMDTMILSFHYDEEIFEQITEEDIVVCDEMSLFAYNETENMLCIEGKANNYLDDIIITFSLKVKKQADSYTFGIEEANAAYLGEDITLTDSIDIVF